MPGLICKVCQTPYPSQGMPYRCPHCSGYYDYDGPLEFDFAQVDRTQPGMWQYRKAFNLFEGAPVVSLGEGNTPLIWENVSGKQVGLKMESYNPTGSYKDRGTAVLVSQLLSRGVSEALEDSSGNAGASFAAYAARVGMRARVFVPESASGPKRTQIEMFGADLIRVPGPRSAAAAAVLAEVTGGKVYASHAYMPFGLAGIASIAYELWENLGGAPGTVIAPAGHGGLLRGIVMGFSALVQSGYIDRRPYYVGVQAGACAPLQAVFAHGLAAMSTVVEGPTIAEGVRVRTPSQAEALLQAIPRTQGEILAIEEEEILPAYQILGRRGISIEPTSALAWCALQKIIERVPEPIILVMTGAGLKYQPKET